MTHDDRYKKSGLTVALGGALADSIRMQRELLNKLVAVMINV
jgi:hypothetical protein